MKSDPQVRRVVDQFQLGLPNTPVAGRSGELLGRGTGSSLEFQEHREYLPGDDIRHLDWAAYARTDSLMIRMYREEISPRTQIFLDASSSMSTGAGQKSLVARQLAGSFSMMVSRLGARPSVVLLGDQHPPRTLEGDESESLSSLAMNQAADISQLIDQRAIPLKPKAARILISDFLFPHDPVNLVRHFGNDCSLLWVVQVLNEFEADPQSVGGRRLVDVETKDQADLRINAGTIARYLKRLHRLQAHLREHVQRQHGTFLTVVAERGLPAICQDDLCRVGILRPR